MSCAGPTPLPHYRRFTNADIAAVAVGAPCGEGHAGAKYILTGPQSLTQRDQVLTIGDAIGRPPRFEEIPPDMALPEMARLVGPPIADMLLIFRRHRETRSGDIHS